MANPTIQAIMNAPPGEAAALGLFPGGTGKMEVGHERDQARSDEPNGGQISAEGDPYGNSYDGPRDPSVEPLEKAGDG